MTDDDVEGVARGVCDAFIGILSIDTMYPFAREDLLAAITEGVRQAFAEVFGKAL